MNAFCCFKKDSFVSILYILYCFKKKALIITKGDGRKCFPVIAQVLKN